MEASSDSESVPQRCGRVKGVRRIYTSSSSSDSDCQITDPPHPKPGDTPPPSWTLTRKRIRAERNRKDREEYRKTHIKAQRRGDGAIIKSFCPNGRQVPYQRENLCLFTCIAMHFFRNKFRCNLGVMSRSMYVLYKMKEEFDSAKLQRAVELVRREGGQRDTIFSVLCAYLYNDILPPKSRERSILNKNINYLLSKCVGHPLDDLIDVENYFDLRIRLWAKGGPDAFYADNSDSDNDGDDVPPSRLEGEFAKCTFPSARNSGTIVDLHISDDQTHVDFITNLNRFADQFICPNCDQNFSELRHCRIHESKCGVGQNYKYIGGVFNPRKTVFERLEENEIPVPDGLEFLEYFIVFDFESLLQAIQNKNKGENGVYEEHVPVSVGIGSNIDAETVEGFFLCNEDPLELVREFIQKLLELSDVICDLVKPKYQILFDQLDKKIVACAREKNIKQENILRKLYNDLNNLISRAVVLSFNGSKYDIVLILGYFFHVYKEMGNFNEEPTDQYKDGTLKTDKFKNILQRGSQVMTMVTDRLCFKDVSLFLAPGCSYKKYLQNFSDDIEKLEKLIYPYQKAKCFEDLHSTELPKFEDFWSDLEQKVGITQEQYARFKSAWGDKENPDLIKGGGTLKDILKEYNLADVSPMVKAVQKHMNVYKNELGVDLFYEYISLPSVGLKWMFKGEKEKFYNFPQAYGFLHRQIQSGRTGGLCTVFHRKVEVGGEMRRYHEPEEGICETPKICRSISFIDATSLYPAMYYLYDFFVGAPIYRRPPNFHPEKVGIDHGVSAESHTWLRYCERIYGVKIISGHNTGEICVSSLNYPVDGFSRPQKNGDRGMVFQYDSCKIHGHECEENDIERAGKDLPPDERAKKIAELKADARFRLARTVRIRNFLVSEGYDVVSTFSCKWAKKQKEKQVRDALRETGGEHCTLYPSSCLGDRGITTEDIISKVSHDFFHGLLKVDIYLEEPWATKYEFFPFFCQNQMVYADCLSEEMQQILEDNETLKRPVKQLVSTSNAKSIILTSQLLKWYLEHHAKVDHLHWCLEYKRAPVFREKIEKMARWRRAATSDIKLKAQADCAKLLSNASIGKTGEDVTRHKNTSICGPSEVHKKVQLNTFIAATPIPTPNAAGRSSASLQTRVSFRDFINEIDELDMDEGPLLNEDEGDGQLYVVETDKSNYVFKNPSTIQFTVYNHAKMHMLTMAIDVLLEYTEEGSCAIAYTDTDSFCLEFSSPGGLDSVIRESKREDFFRNRHKWFPQEWCEGCFDQYLACKMAGGVWDRHMGGCPNCEEKYKHEFYTPGIFKNEGSGDRAIFLSPKMYILEDTQTGFVKSGCKGVSTRCNTLTFKLLHDKLMGACNDATPTTNYLFNRRKYGGVGTAKMKKFSISKIYTKRKCMRDMLNTLPLARHKVGNYDVCERAYIDDDDSNDNRDNLVGAIMDKLENDVINELYECLVEKCVTDVSIC